MPLRRPWEYQAWKYIQSEDWLAWRKGPRSQGKNDNCNNYSTEPKVSKSHRLKQSSSLDFLWKRDWIVKKCPLQCRSVPQYIQKPLLLSGPGIQSKISSSIIKNYPPEQENIVLICNPVARARIQTAGKRVSKIPGKKHEYNQKHPNGRLRCNY